MKLRDATRLAIQSALAAAATYLIMHHYDLPEVLVGVLSAVLVIDISVGHTLGQAQQRILATLLGSLIGLICVWLFPWGYGTVIALVVSMLIMNAVASYHSSWRYGVVAAVTLALGAENNLLDVTLDRMIALLLGISVGLLISLIVWPEKSETRAKRYARKALRAAAIKFTNALHTRQEGKAGTKKKISYEFHRNLGSAKEAADAVKFIDSDRVQNIVEHVEKLYNSILILDRIAEKSTDCVTNDHSGIKQDVYMVQRGAISIMRALAQGQGISEEEWIQFSERVDSARMDVQLSDDRYTNTIRQTFIFGLNEVKENLEVLITQR